MHYYTILVLKIHDIGTSFSVDLSEAVVAHLVHNAVVEGGAALPVHAELPARGVVIKLLQ